MPTHVCQKCGRVFKRKSGYDDHLQMKTDCALKTDISAVVVPIVESALRNTEEKTIVLSSSKEVRDKQLTAYFEKLHHLLWVRAGLSPEKAVDHMTFFIAFRLLEDQADTIGLPQECRWSYLIQCLKSGETDGANVVRKACSSFRTKGGRFRDLFPVLEITKDDVICNIVRHIDTIERKQLTDKDVLGVLFEYLIGRGMQTMSDEGQYFTDRKICEKAFDIAYNIKKTVRRKDGSICTFADWFCGTGGFATQYIHGVSEHESVNWKEGINSIYCQDMSKNSCAITLLNLLILTGEMAKTSVRYGDSFHDPLFIGDSAPFKGIAIDYCFMNPPYGGDKTKGKEYRFVYSTGGTKKIPKRFEVNAEIQTIGIEDDDKVSAGVQLAMASLAPEGVCCIVLPQGFFFGVSAKVVELRKRLAEEYKIHCVVDIASGSFANTATKTSMLVFQHGVGTTESVKFIGMDDKILGEAKLSDLRAKKYSLNYKQYLPQEAVEVEGFEMVKLGDILDKKSPGKTKVGEITNSGEYPFYSCKIDNPCGTHCQFDHDESEYLLFAKSGGNAKQPTGDNLGIGHFYYMTKKSASTTDVCKLVSKSKKEISLKYVSLVLKTKLYAIQSLARYTTGLGHIDVDQMLNEIQIPLPSLERQQEIVAAINVWNDFARREEEMLAMLEKQIMFYVKEMGKGKEQVKLGDVCDIKPGKNLTKEELLGGEVPVVGGGLSPMGYHNVSNQEAFSIILAHIGANAGHISRYPVKSWITNNGLVAKPKSGNSITNDVLYYLLKNIQDEIKGNAEGTAQPKLSVSSVLSLGVQIPSAIDQQTLQSDFDEIRHKYAKIAEYKAKAQDAIKRLIPQITSCST